MPQDNTPARAIGLEIWVLRFVYWSDRVRTRTRRIGYKFKPFVCHKRHCSRSLQNTAVAPSLTWDGPPPIRSTELRSGHDRECLDVVSAIKSSTNFFRINRHLLNFCNNTYNQYTGVFTDRKAPSKKWRVCARGLLNCAHWSAKRMATHSIRKVNIACFPFLQWLLHKRHILLHLLKYPTSKTLYYVSQMPEVSDIHPTQQQEAHVSTRQCFRRCFLAAAVRSGYIYLCIILCRLCCSVRCLCVTVYCTVATGCQPNCS